MSTANGVEQDFESWLSFKLRSLKTDEGVFGSYISGILSGEESVDEKTEAIEGILSEITETDISSHCHEILERWRNSRGTVEGEESPPTGSTSQPSEDMNDRLVKLMESNTKTTSVARQCTAEDKKIKEAILAQYSQTSDHENDSGGEEKTVDSKKGLEKNTNATAVAQAEKEKREKAKLDSQKKKEKDKEDREKQKQQQQEKKEKRKTQKGERRR